MNVYPRNHFGPERVLDQVLIERLQLVNSDIMTLIRMKPELNSISGVRFEILDNPIEIHCTVAHENGNFTSRFFEDYIDEAQIYLAEWKAKLYFSARSFFAVESFFIENDGVLPYSFLEENEPELLKQLKKEFLIRNTPANSRMELNENDLSFFMDVLEHLER